jgi:hypothetical protein
LARSSCPRDLINRMMSIHEDRANPYTLWLAGATLSAKSPPSPRCGPASPKGHSEAVLALSGGPCADSGPRAP